MEGIEIVYLPIDKITPYEQNAKKHPANQVEHIANSIREFGFRQPLVVDADNVIVIGHGRLLAAKKLGMKEVPAVRADDLTQEQIKALRLADNKTNESEWDFGLLSDELGEIFEINMSDFGFENISTFETADDVVEDEYDEEYPEEPKAKLGDIYQLGEHRLMCGDSTSVKDVAKLMNGENAELLFTSPPYSDMREYNGGKMLDVQKLATFINAYSDSCSYLAVNLGIKRDNYEIVPYWNYYIDAAHASGKKLLAWNIWDKGECGSIANQNAFIPIRHEFIFVFGSCSKSLNKTWEKKPESINQKKTSGLRQKDGSIKTITRGDTTLPMKEMESVLLCTEVKGAREFDHPAPFPIGLPFEYIIALSEKNDIIVEPFGGSGTTLMACEQSERKCYIMELDEHYVDTIIARWEKFTGRKAKLIESR